MKYRLMILMVAVFALSFANTSYGYTAKDVSNGGKLAGKITLDGEALAPLSFPIEKNKDVCGTGVREVREVTVDGNGGLQHAVVYFEKIKEGKKWEKDLYRLNQKTCTFDPWIQVMEVKKELEIVNHDPVLHNIHTYELIGRVRVTLFNEAQPTQGYTFVKKIKLRRSNIVKIECDAHNFMHAYMLALKNPYFSITAADGTYSIDQVPPGKYKVTVWHSKLGKKSQEVEVTAGGSAELNHAFKS